MAKPTREDVRQAFEGFRGAVRELVEIDPERAFLYLRGATCSLRDWSRDLRANPSAVRGAVVGEPKGRA